MISNLGAAGDYFTNIGVELSDVNGGTFASLNPDKFAVTLPPEDHPVIVVSAPQGRDLTSTSAARTQLGAPPQAPAGGAPRSACTPPTQRRPARW